MKFYEVSAFVQLLANQNSGYNDIHCSNYSVEILPRLLPYTTL